MKQEHFAMDYVYDVEGSDEFRSVRVVLLTDTYDDFLEVVIKSDEPISEVELDKILTSLWAERFAKLGVSLVTDCKLSLVVGGSSHRIIVSQNSDDLKISVDEFIEI